MFHSVQLAHARGRSEKRADTTLKLGIAGTGGFTAKAGAATRLSKQIPVAELLPLAPIRGPHNFFEAPRLHRDFLRRLLLPAVFLFGLDRYAAVPKRPPSRDSAGVCRPKKSYASNRAR